MYQTIKTTIVIIFIFTFWLSVCRQFSCPLSPVELCKKQENNRARPNPDQETAYQHYLREQLNVQPHLLEKKESTSLVRSRGKDASLGPTYSAYSTQWTSTRGQTRKTRHFSLHLLKIVID